MYPVTAVRTELVGDEIVLSIQYSTERMIDPEKLQWCESLTMTEGQAKAVIHELEHRLKELQTLSRDS